MTAETRAGRAASESVNSTIWRQMIMKKLAALVAVAFFAGQASGAEENQDFEAAKQEYEQSSRDEAARATFVTKLAKIRDRQIQHKQ